MAKTIIGLCTIELHLPGIASLKAKRSILKSLLARLHNQFNISAAEVDHHDLWQSAMIAVVVVSNAASHNHQVMNNVVDWIEENFPDVFVTQHQTEIL